MTRKSGLLSRLAASRGRSTDGLSTHGQGWSLFVLGNIVKKLFKNTGVHMDTRDLKTAVVGVHNASITKKRFSI
jgi:hypothetical protein